MMTDFPPLKTIEDQIIAVLVNKLLEAGYSITVNDGEDDVLEGSKDVAAIHKAMESTDRDSLYVHKDHDSGRANGWVLLIYGNDQDVILHYQSGTHNRPDPRLDQQDG